MFKPRMTLKGPAKPLRAEDDDDDTKDTNDLTPKIQVNNLVLR